MRRTRSLLKAFIVAALIGSPITATLVAPVAYAQTRVPVISDDFNRASLGTDWTQTNAEWISITISASTFAAGSGTGADAERASAYWDTDTLNDDQYASATINSFSFQTAATSAGVMCRSSTEIHGSRDNYQFVVLSDSGGPDYTTVLAKVVNGNGGYAVLHSAQVAWANGDEIEIECEGDEIRGMKNGSPLSGFTLMDTDLTSGFAGVVAATTAPGLTAFTAGNITASSGGLLLRRRRE